MDQNHEETETAQVSADHSASAETAAPQGAAEPAAAPEGEPAEKAAAAPVRRRASRRVSAAAGEVVAPPTEPGAPAADAAAAKAESEPQAEAAGVAAASETAEEAPKKRVSRARKKVESSETGEAAADAVATATDDSAAEQAPAEQAPAEEAPAKPARATRARSTRTTTKKAAEPAASAASEAAAEDSAVKSAEAASAETAAPDTAATGASSDAEASTADAAGDASAPRRRNTRSRSRKPAADAAATADAAQGEQADQAASAPAADAAADSASGNGEQNQDRSTTETQSGDNGERQENSGARENQTRSNRTRQRERKRRGPNDDGELELSDDDVLLPIAGILDVLDNYAFVRTSGYLPGTGDVYVSLGQVKKYGLRKGDAVVGAIRQPREGDGGGRQKYNAIVKVDTVNSGSADEQQTRPEFAELTPVHPAERMRLETDSATLGPRVIDLFAPVGKGQRGLIIGPHESGKSALLRQIAHAVAQNQPGAHLMMVLIDERPEEVTELQRSINGEVIASTFDRPAEDHTTIAELAIERAKRLVELGHDVVVLIDSLTDLARAYNLAAPAAVRVPAGNLDAAAVFPVKRLLSAARNIENGGSLTILATVSAQADSRLDEALIGELEGIANMQLRMSGEAADRRVFPSIELRRSSTRNEQLITSDAEHRVMSQLRRRLQDAGETEALDTVLGELGRTSSNVEFLAVTQRAQA